MAKFLMVAAVVCVAATAVAQSAPPATPPATTPATPVDPCAASTFDPQKCDPCTLGKPGYNARLCAEVRAKERAETLEADRNFQLREAVLVPARQYFLERAQDRKFRDFLQSACSGAAQQVKPEEAMGWSVEQLYQVVTSMEDKLNQQVPPAATVALDPREVTLPDRAEAQALEDLKELLKKQREVSITPDAKSWYVVMAVQRLKGVMVPLSHGTAVVTEAAPAPTVQGEAGPVIVLQNITPTRLSMPRLVSRQHRSSIAVPSRRIVRAGGAEIPTTCWDAVQANGCGSQVCQQACPPAAYASVCPGR